MAATGVNFIVGALGDGEEADTPPQIVEPTDSHCLPPLPDNLRERLR